MIDEFTADLRGKTLRPETDLRTFGGLPIKILWCFARLAPGLLATSGFLIWRSRTRRRGALSRIQSHEK